MAKQSKKEQKEKHDLELILEQVKQNIVSEPSDEQSANPDDQDEALISMLSKVFSDTPESENNVSYREKKAEAEVLEEIIEAPVEIEEQEENIEASVEIEEQEENIEASVEIEKQEEIIEASVEIEKQEEIIEASVEIEKQEEIIEASVEIEEQEEIVEAEHIPQEHIERPVLKAEDVTNALSEDSSLDIGKEKNAVEALDSLEYISITNDGFSIDKTEDGTEVEIETEIEDEAEDEIEIEVEDKAEDEIEIEVAYEITDEPEFALDSDLLDEQVEDDEDLTVSVEDEEYDTESPIIVLLPSEELTPAVEETEDSHKEENPPRLILSADQYIFDPLQEGIPSSIKSKKMSAISAPSENAHEKQASSDKQFDINDISLLLKFGYDEEVKSKLGEDTTQEAILARDNYYVPEKHRIPFGYCGKEFTDRQQIPAIKAKYKAEKHAIIAKLIAISIIATLILCSTIFFEFFSDRTSYPLILSVEILLLLIIGGILGKKLYEGVLGIIRFEAGQYAILFLIMCANLVYNIITIICYAANRNSLLNLKTSEFMLFSFTVSVYAILALVSDLINCIKESGTFEIIASSENLYTAEKQSSKTINDVRNNDDEETANSNYLHSNEHAYKLRKTRLISGYFKKTSLNKSGNVNLIYLLGIVPIISLVIGCICALLGGDMMRGVSSVMLTILLCVPFSFLFTHSISEYIFSSKLKEQKIAFIGNESPVEYAQTDTIIVSDCDTVEIVSHKEIQPGKNANVKKYISTAYEVFRALGGTLSEIAEKESGEAEGERQGIIFDDHELIINEITENGIHIYYDSSQNILLGDRGYMRDHGINVKTDTNLTTATKGNDKAVIYVAFDGSPRLGFILQSKIKDDFHNILEVLNDENIRIFVESYEPHINDQFFETNKESLSIDIKVHKPDEFENPHNRQICDGRVISADNALSLAKAIPFSREILAQRKRTGRIHLTLVACGILASCLLTLLLNVRNGIPFWGFMKSHITLLFNILMACGSIPAIVCLTKLNKNNRSEK